MGMKALERLVEHAEERADGDPPKFVREARAELAGIRKAAKAWVESDVGELPEAEAAVMESIAKETP
jgi:hypothetical protein